MKKSILIVTLLMVLNSLQPATTADKLRVTLNNANIRSRPELSAEIVLKAGKGDVFTVVAKQGNWYKILIPADSGSQAAEGYIHSGLCEIISLDETAAEKDREKPVSRPKRTSKAAPASTQGIEKLFSGFYAKFGLLASPKVSSFGDKWLLDFGKDWGIINPFLAAGFEVQPYFRSFSNSSFSASTLGANIFINAKGGVNLGRFVEKLKFLTPYLGFGLGAAFSTSSSTYETEKISRTDFYFAWHMIFGFEVVLKKMSVILEFQTGKISVPELDPDLSQKFLFLGVRF